VAIHEVMEQQTVTIAKAGIHASLNARSSVLAAANPIYGQYDKTRRPQENIGLPDSLLSRFDLLFIVLDQLDSTLDRTLSEHVIRSHQYRRAGTLMEPEPLNVGSSINLDEVTDASIAVDTPMWQRGSRVFGDASGKATAQGELLTKEFLRKYIHYAKLKLAPVLSDEAMEMISASYANMRARQSRKNLPVTARTLETIIRLSTAAAKARLSSSVDDCDVEVAMELMNFVLFHEIGSDAETPVASDVSALKGKFGKDADANKENRINLGSATQTSVYDDVASEGEGSVEDLGINDEQYRNVHVDATSPRFLEVQSTLEKFMSAGEDVIPLDALMRRLNQHTPSGAARRDRYKRKEVVTILYELERQNKVRALLSYRCDVDYYMELIMSVIVCSAGDVQ
jgi:DNA replicative helicase MCM subunit Mcm2 (Cdc46/Mcm family)